MRINAKVQQWKEVTTMTEPKPNPPTTPKPSPQTKPDRPAVGGGDKPGPKPKK